MSAVAALRDEVKRALAAVPLFAVLTEAELAALAPLVQVREVARGVPVIRFGEPGLSLFLILEGSARVSRPVGSGPEVMLDILSRGEFFGELALLDGKPRSASVIALEAMRLGELARDPFLEYLHAHPGAAIEIIGVLGSRLRQTNDRVAEAYFSGLGARLARALLEAARRLGTETTAGVVLGQRLTRAELASRVGVSAPRVTLLLSAWQDQGLLELGQEDAILLTRPDLLEVMCR